MYIRRSIKQANKVKVPAMPVQEYQCDHTYHPLSYYLYGGADPTGEHLDLNRTTISDTPDDIAAGCTVDAMCDPKTNYFDIVEQIGVQNAEKASASVKAGETEE